MNKKSKYLITITILSLIFCNKVYASCSEIELNHFKKIESQYKVTYNYDANNNQNIIKIYNPEPSKYEYRIVTNESDNANVVFKRIDNYNYEVTGKIYVEYTIEVVGKTSTCNDVLKTLTITPPPENGYHDDPLCEGIEDFALCQSEYKKPITREEFESRVETYKENLKTENQKPSNSQNNQTSNFDEKNETENNDIINKIIKYGQENLTTVIIIIIFIILLIITATITIKNAIKRRRLE